MKKIFAVALLLMVFASPAFAAGHHSHHHPHHPHHHHQRA
jgi:predicted S18 family serine protease